VQGPRIGVNPLALMFSVAFAASYSYVLPASTPHNAIVYAYARFSRLEMVRSRFRGFVIQLLLIFDPLLLDISPSSLK